MQPVQLSLMPDPAPAPPTSARGLPTEAVAAATALLAGVIAKAVAPPGMKPPGTEASADE